MSNYDIIELYQNMRSISNICKGLGVDQGNLSKHILKEDALQRVSNEIVFEIVKAYSKILIGRLLNDKTDTL